MRAALTDKSLPVQRAASQVCIVIWLGVIVEFHEQVLVAMHSSSDASILSLNELDSIIAQSVKSLETADQATRHSHAQLVGHLLASTQIERVVPPPETTQKSKKDSSTAEQQNDDPSPSNAAEVTKPMLTPTEMFTHLSTHLNKQYITRKTRIGIFDFYAVLLTKLGASFVETNFSLIVSHLVTEIVSSPRSAATRYDILLTRSLVGILLRDLVGVRMLSEQGQISAIQELANAYLKRWPAMMPGQVAPSSQVLVIALREVAGLLQQLGNAPPPVQVSCYFSHATKAQSTPIFCTECSRRAISFPSLSPQPYRPCHCFVGTSMFLLLNTPSLAKNYLNCHGQTPAGPCVDPHSWELSRYSSSSLRSRLRSRGACVHYSSTAFVCLLRRQCQGPRYGEPAPQACWRT